MSVATELNSLKLSSYLLSKCLGDPLVYKLPNEFYQFLLFANEELLQKKRSLRGSEEATNPNELLKTLFKRAKIADVFTFTRLLDQVEQQNKDLRGGKDPSKSVPSNYVKTVAEFWRKFLERKDLDQFFTCYTVAKGKKGQKYPALEVVALDCRDITRSIYASCYCSLNLTGTINPYVYKSLTGVHYKYKKCDNQTEYKEFSEYALGSPFPREHVFAVVTEGVNTKKNLRTPLMYEKIKNKIVEVVKVTEGNIGVFCASYNILNDLCMAGILRELKATGKKVYAESSRNSASVNATMVEEFKEKSSQQGAVLIGVSGGRNSEGEDFPGTEMNAVIMVGVPFHLPSPRIKAKINYFDKMFGKKSGWNMAYLAPAMQRANQASGRPIRKEEDKGFIVFMDERFKERAAWLSNWVKRDLLVIGDKPGLLSKFAKKFWEGAPRKFNNSPSYI